MGRILPGGREGRESQEGHPHRRDKAIGIGELSVLMELGFLWEERQTEVTSGGNETIALLMW